MDVPGEKLPADLPSYLRTTVAPEVPVELRAAFLEAVETGNIRSMQNKQLTSKPLHQPGMLGFRHCCCCCFDGGIMSIGCVLHKQKLYCYKCADELLVLGIHAAMSLLTLPKHCELSRC